MSPQTCLFVLVFACLAGSGLSGIVNGKYVFCGCSITVSTTCPSGSGIKAGSCNNNLLYDEGCKLMCTADKSTPTGKATELMGKSGLNFKAYEFIGCNNNQTVNSTGTQMSFTGVACHINMPTNLCPDMPYIASPSDCPAGKNCMNVVKRWNNDIGTDQMTCDEGYLFVRENGTWTSPTTPYCNNVGTWSNSSILSGSTGFYVYKSPTVFACAASKTVVQCTYPTEIAEGLISADFKLHNNIGTGKMVFKNESLLGGMRVSCQNGYQLAAFSSSNPTSADLSFTASASLKCADGASWVNSLTGSLPFDFKPACVVPLASCDCGYTKYTDDDFPGCHSDILRPVVGPYGCQLDCVPGYRMVGSFSRHGRRSRLNKFFCHNGWHGKRTLFDDDYEEAAGTSSPFATCEVDPLDGCPAEIETFECEFCDMAYLTWTAATSRLSCSQGVLIGTTSIEFSFSALNWFHTMRYNGGAWFGLDFYVGFSSTVAVPVFSCWMGEYEPSPIIHANATDNSCSACGFCFMKNNQPDEACVDGTLTLTYSSTSGTICQSESELSAVISLSCTNGVWTLEGEVVDMDFPITRCEGPILEETTVVMEEATTVMEEATTEGAVQMTCEEEECSGCSWWGFESDPCRQTCMSAVLQIDFGMDFHVCSSTGSIDINVNAMFCRNGTWFYLNAEGEIEVELGSNPLTACQPPEPEHRDCDKPGCEGCSFSFFPGFFPHEICYNGMLTLDFGFFSNVCMGFGVDFSATAIYCENGEWSMLTADGSVSIEAPSSPLQTCMPPPPEDESDACDDMCGWKQHHGCGPRPRCHGGHLELSYDDDDSMEGSGSGSGSHEHGDDNHICVAGSPINVDKLFCKRGNWWYKGGWGHFPFFLTPFTFFRPCHPAPPQEYHCELQGCDSACTFWGFPWWMPRQSCNSGVFQIDFEVSQMCVFELDVHVEAMYCQGGRWFSDVELSIEVVLGESPVTTCGGEMTTMEPAVETTEAPGCQFEHQFEDCHGVVPVQAECVEDSPSFWCGEEGDIMVSIEGSFHRFHRVNFLRDLGWFAFDCSGRFQFIGFEAQFRCRNEDEEPSSGSSESGSGSGEGGVIA